MQYLYRYCLITTDKIVKRTVTVTPPVPVKTPVPVKPPPPEEKGNVIYILSNFFKNYLRFKLSFMKHLKLIMRYN